MTKEELIISLLKSKQSIPELFNNNNKGILSQQKQDILLVR